MTNDQTVTQAPFVREERYIVIKRSHLSEGKESDLRTAMDEIGIDTVDCVVVEADWPEYEPVWQMIEDRMSGRIAHSGEGRSNGSGEDALSHVMSSIPFGNLSDLVRSHRDLRPGTFAYGALIDLLDALATRVPGEGAIT